MSDTSIVSTDDRGIHRRAMVKTALGALAAGLAAMAPGAAQAAVLVSPNPIKTRIQKSGLAVEVQEFCTVPASSATRPYASLNYLFHAGDGTQRLFACDSYGKLWQVSSATGATRLVLDIARVRGTAFYFEGTQSGLRSCAFHPDFARPGRPGYRKLFTAHTETAASRRAGVPLLAMAPSTPVGHHNVIVEWAMSVADPTRVDPATRREVLRIAQQGPDHCTDQILFNPKAKIGAPDYGKLYVGTGDGGLSRPRPDRYDHAQNPACALGKVLRIDPLRQSDGRRYAVPADNPFVGRSGWLPEIWALGLRHPQNLSFDPGSGVLLLTDIGQYFIEEVNIVTRGGNHGWPLREGTFATNRNQETLLYALPAGDAANRFTYPVAQYDHDEAKDAHGRPIAGGLCAITGGFVHRGASIPALVGQYIFGDLVTGRIFHVPVQDLRLGSLATINELTLLRQGKPVTLQQLVGTTDRVDLRFGQSEGGSVLLLTKQDGKIRKLARA